MFQQFLIYVIVSVRCTPRMETHIIVKTKSSAFRFHIPVHFLYLLDVKSLFSDWYKILFAFIFYHRPLNSVKFSHCFSDPSVPSVCSVIFGQIAVGMFFCTCVLARPVCSQSTISGQALDSGHITRLFRLWCGDLLPVCFRIGFGLIYKLLTHGAFAPLPDCWNGYSMCWW